MADNNSSRQESLERINNFLSGHDPMEHIVSVECGYQDNFVSVIYNAKDGIKRIKKDKFYPFVWAKRSAVERMLVEIKDSRLRRKELSRLMLRFGIRIKKLNNGNGGSDRLENGYIYMFYADRPLSFQHFAMFFEMVGTPLRKKEDKKKESGVESSASSREFLSVSPIEQYLIASGKRFFKGYEAYDELKRLLFDLETTGLNPKVDSIDQIGIRTNKGFEKIISIEGETKEEKRKNELAAIEEFVKILATEKPDIIAGHNSENFDWDFIITRCEMLGTSLKDISSKYFAHPIRKKVVEAVLKLGGEVEYYHPTVMWGHTILDSLHAVRRAQAIDSSMKSANLKYVTKYLNLNKENRVYVKGNEIGNIWRVKTPTFAFNNEDGTYYPITEEKPLEGKYEAVSGKYVVERYLLDDIWETDKVELALNEANFLIAKILPTTFQRACTMGTAAIWKMITLAWCYENNLAVPAFGEPARFVGGLSRLLQVGYVDNVVKLDYNSLYPSIILTWQIASKLDISNSLLLILEYVLTQREKYKKLKKDAKKKKKSKYLLNKGKYKC